MASSDRSHLGKTPRIDQKAYNTKSFTFQNVFIFSTSVLAKLRLYAEGGLAKCPSTTPVRGLELFSFNAGNLSTLAKNLNLFVFTKSLKCFRQAESLTITLYFFKSNKA